MSNVLYAFLKGQFKKDKVYDCTSEFALTVEGWLDANEQFYSIDSDTNTKESYYNNAFMCKKDKVGTFKTLYLFYPGPVSEKGDAEWALYHESANKKVDPIRAKTSCDNNKLRELKKQLKKSICCKNGCRTK
jgi:hypothetical protein